MSKDHYVAQTYLKQFGDSSAAGMLHAYRKPDGISFDCWPKDVCHEWDGDRNPFLAYPELLGTLRSIFEPQWNMSVANILTGSTQDKLVVASYMANMMVCVPAWQRVGSEAVSRQTTGALSFEKQMREKHEALEDFPAEAVDMLASGKLKMVTEPDYVKALATRHLMDYTWLTYNIDWIILENDTPQGFLTSDNPVAMDNSGAIGAPVFRYMPITPALCLSVKYDPRFHHLAKLDPARLAEEFQRPPTGTVSRSKVASSAVRELNKLFIQSAESLVFSAQQFEKLPALVRKYGKYRLESEHVEFPGEEDNSRYLGEIIRVRERSA
jgi:hypothetical protein